MTEMTGAVDAEVAAAKPAGSHDALSVRGSADVAGSPPGQTPTAAFAQRRAELGLSLDDVANQIKFSTRQITSLEAGDFDKLAGGTFARGMMRSYARLLKLDPEQIFAQLAASGATRQNALDQEVSLRAPIPFSEGGKHVNFAYVAVSLVILAIVVFFAFEWYLERNGTGKLAFVLPGAPLSAARESLPATLASSARTPVRETVSRVEGRTAGGIGERIAEKTVEKPAEKTGANPAVHLAAGKRRIVLRFEREAWVEIKTAKGTTLLSQLNPAGSEKVIEGEPPFSLTIGNAPGVRLTYNDQPVDLRPHFHVDVARLTLN